MHVSRLPSMRVFWTRRSKIFTNRSNSPFWVLRAIPKSRLRNHPISCISLSLMWQDNHRGSISSPRMASFKIPTETRATFACLINPWIVPSLSDKHPGGTTCRFFLGMFLILTCCSLSFLLKCHYLLCWTRHVSLLILNSMFTGRFGSSTEWRYSFDMKKRKFPGDGSWKPIDVKETKPEHVLKWTTD